MENYFIDTPSGQLIAAHHIVALDVQGSGQEEETRHAVQATLVTGDKQTLQLYQGLDSQRQAQQFIGDLLKRLGAQRFGNQG